MTEHDLSTLLRDDLAGEPPLAHTGADAIRTARRQSARRRLLAGGVAALAVVGVVALGSGLPDPVRDDAMPATGAADLPERSVAEVMEEAARGGFGAFVGRLGEPAWSVNTVLGDSVPAGAADAQHYLLSYRPASGPTQLNLSVGGFAPPDMERYGFAESCVDQEAEGRAQSCEITTLEDGSVLMTTVALRSDIETDAPRVLTRREAAAMPVGTVSWVRVASLSTPDGVAVDAAEYVPADDLDAPEWHVPLPLLRGLVLSPALRGADVAHEPMPLFTDE